MEDFRREALSAADQADFASHVKAPTLLISGNFDWIFPRKDALMRLLGAPEADKKAVVFDTAHDVSEQRVDSFGRFSPGSTNIRARSTRSSTA
jgi:hypothetical protein